MEWQLEDLTYISTKAVPFIYLYLEIFIAEELNKLILKSLNKIKAYGTLQCL